MNSKSRAALVVLRLSDFEVKNEMDTPVLTKTEVHSCSEKLKRSTQ